MKRTRDYTIYTINARAMLKLYERRDGSFDMTSEYDRNLIVEDIKSYSESALFYQIRNAAKELGEADSPDTVTRKLVYLHFKNGVVDENGNENIKEELSELLEKGVKLRFKGDKEFHNFIPFDKSASMSRNNTISFIRDDVFDKVDASLRLGLIWNLIDIESSKYYAYRGLYMTDGVEVPPSAMELNEKTVIVLGIDTISVHDKTVSLKYSDEDRDLYFSTDGKIKVSKDLLKKAEKFTSLPYDGEGLVCPQYARIINKKAIRDATSDATSFQIRMPFSKGMLHTVDFHKFLEDQFPDEDINKLEIEDYFGIKRKISDARIILTKSMFKCASWFKDYYKTEDSEDGEYRIDPMEDYFHAFHKFKHALYIVSSDANFKSDEYVKMNYQFLNTLDMDKDTFEKLVKKHISDTREITIDPYKGRSAILRNDDSENESVNEDGEVELGNMESWEYALNKNVSFITDPKISEMLKQVQDGQVRDIRRGRLIVPGTLKYLSGDLLYLLTIIAEKCGVQNQNRIEYLRDYRILYPDRFYIAGRQNYKLDDKKYYGILRSPHLSRNEQCALRPVKLQIYNKYFNHLKGVIMVSDKSSVPAALGGADFDGDIVKIIRDDDINDAIFNSVYEKATVTIETEEGPKDRVINQRKLPVVDIVPPDIPGERIGERINYEDIRRAFSSNVGKISNTALTIGKLEYGNCKDAVSIPEDSTALCTIATGLEIDSVKTGIKPDTSELEKLITDESDKYLSVKRVFDRISGNDKERSKVVHAETDDKTGGYKAYFKYRGKTRNTKTLYTINPEQESNIDMLPYYYAKELAEKKSVSKQEKQQPADYQIPKYRFKFEADEGWVKKTSLDPRLHALMKIVGSYKKIILDAWSFSRAREKTKSESFRASVFTLLNTEYDRDMDSMYMSGASIDDAMETAYEVMYDAMPFSSNVDKALERLKKSDWQYLRSFEEKEKMLKEIIEEDDIPLKALELFCDTYDNGYQYLNYILRDTGLFRKAEEQELEDAESDSVPVLQKIPEGRKYDKIFDETIYRKLHSEYRKTPANRSVWMRKAAGVCRNEVYNLYEGNMVEAIKCTLLLDGTHDYFSDESNTYDENHRFLWDVFTAEDMSKVVYTEEEVESDAQ